MKIKFSKMHGLGNDFIVINNLELQHPFSPEQIRYLADRKFGIGCDQVLLIERATDGVSDFFYRIFNSDGSIAGQCGNGARCFIRFVVERGLISRSKVYLQTLDRVITGALLHDDIVKVDMGVPNFIPSQIPLNATEQKSYFLDIGTKQVEFFAVSMGNPHAVIKLPERSLLTDDEYLSQIAMALQQSEFFPESVNVNFVYVDNHQQISLRTFERGCGFTLACGSGACASAAIAIREAWADSLVKVVMLGGNLDIEWHGVNLIMRGQATFVFDGELEL